MHLQSMPVCTGWKTIPAILFPRTIKSQKSGIRICAIIWEKRLTASGSMCQNTLSIMQKNMLKLPSISTKEHSRLHLVNLYGLFLDCWSKTNCTPAKSWTLNQISTRTDVRLWIFRRRSIKVTLFPEKYIKIFFKNSWHITRMLKLNRHYLARQNRTL